ncbi:MAG: phosphatidylinositol mannoside acyltransferase [Acidobacteriota bacterium]|nr:phosphatidylinositol mannoside acyltransferase [Acidobacteriota bacterium]MDE3043362.1 phosphatidylinositol mannoside acyltransferase [Acidobacteriota bacterium]MDE3106667.1 phosphatidylinositol mannoside acyltransferase [Acidobacteriota bacterium]
MAGRARVALFKTIGALAEALPERVDVGVARGVARRLGRRQRAAAGNLAANQRRALSLDGVAPSDELLARFVDRGFASYGQYWAEGAKLPALSQGAIDDRFAIAEGVEFLEAARTARNGLVVALPHVGSWEWGGSFLNSFGLGMTAIAEELDPPALFDWFRQKREAIGIQVKPLNDHAGTALLEVLRRGGVVGLLCDRDLQNNGVPVTFFGERVTMPAGPATLALRTGATLLAAACYSGPGRDHYAVVRPPIPAIREGRLREDVARVTQCVATELEGLIRRAPDQWHVLQPLFTAAP